MTKTVQTVPTSQVASMLKAALRAAYPDVRFSVRKGRGTACWWLHVTWTDGPTEPAVQEITDRYTGQKFNGMTDTYDVLPDRLVQFEGEDLPRLVCYQVDGVIVAREMGAAGRAGVAARVAAVAPGVGCIDADGITSETLAPEQAVELAGSHYAYGTATVRDVARPVFARLDLTAAPNTAAVEPPTSAATGAAAASVWLSTTASDLDPGCIAYLGATLLDARTRDMVLITACGRGLAQIPDGPLGQTGAQVLFGPDGPTTDTHRTIALLDHIAAHSTDRPTVAAHAYALLAALTWWTGDYPRARDAITRALHHDSANVLACLVRRSIDGGLLPANRRVAQQDA